MLVVEDNPELSEAFRAVLEHAGFEAAVANSLAEARALRSQAAAVLLDLSLPDGDGLDLLTDPDSGSCVTIALTGHDDRRTIQRCREAGCAQVLVKPVAPNELVATLNALLASA